jgi:DNA-binding NtrC family response regulator
MLNVLLADDDPSLRASLSTLLQSRGHRVTTATSGDDAFARLEREDFDLVISDVQMPGMDGLTLLHHLRHRWTGTDVVLITAYAAVEDAISAIRDRAVDYLTKPFEIDRLLDAVARVDESRHVQRELVRTKDDRSALARLVARSAPMMRVKQHVSAIADSDAAVLITGESGTGKELVARAIHERSPRREQPFVAINCAAVPPTLVGAELFGHERGAFTGADRRREGRFKAANLGTLFLDEIGEMPIEVQALLLRVLQEGTFEPLGSNTPVSVDVRIVSATNRDLKERVSQGRFREDLYYRLKVFDVQLPPLRARAGDLMLLTEQFLRAFTRIGDPVPSLSPAAWAALLGHPFPGNVRELKHAIQHAAVLARGQKEIDLEHLPGEIRGAAAGARHTPALSLPTAVAEFERECIRRALEFSSGERKRAAEVLGISRKVLYQKLARHPDLVSPRAPRAGKAARGRDRP